MSSPEFLFGMVENPDFINMWTDDKGRIHVSGIRLVGPSEPVSHPSFFSGPRKRLHIRNFRTFVPSDGVQS